MVFSCVREELEGGQSMAMGQERSSKPLHNFTLPCTLKWGHQRYFRCVKVHDSSATPSVEGVDHRPVRRRSSPSRTSGFSDAGRRKERESVLLLPSLKRRMDCGEEEEEEEGIEAVREKIMNDLKTAADKMKDAILREETVVSDGDDEEEESPVSTVAAAAAAVVAQGDSVRPWNLRTRRAACKAPIGGGPPASSASKGLLKIEEKKRSSSSSPMRSEVGAKSPRVLRGGAAAAEKEVKKERLKFSVALSKKEIEEDFMQMVNHRPPRRPKKRPRNVQRQLDTLFPGLWLTEVNADSYKVPELPENGKR